MKEKLKPNLKLLASVCVNSTPHFLNFEVVYVSCIGEKEFHKVRCSLV